MSRVPLLGREGAEGEIARTFDILGNFQRRQVNSTRATAHSPFLARIFYPLVQTLMREGARHRPLLQDKRNRRHQNQPDERV